LIASSKLFLDVAVNSVTLATVIIITGLSLKGNRNLLETGDGCHHRENQPRGAISLLDRDKAF
jgi:hypothetical protein